MNTALKRPFAEGVKQGKPKIALIFGKDTFFSLGVANKLVPQMLDKGFEPVLIFADHKPVANDVLPELQQYAFFDRILLETAVYDFLDDKNNKLEGKNGSARRWGYEVFSTPRQIAAQHDLRLIESVPNVNAPSFEDELLSLNNLKGIINIRGIQIFKPDIIDTMNRKGIFFWNLHPGHLPSTRGVLPVMRAMYQKARDSKDEDKRAETIKNYGTLHEIDYWIDTGAILARGCAELDMSASVLENYCSLIGPSTEVIISRLQATGGSVILPSEPQDRNAGSYYGYPETKDLEKIAGYGIQLLPSSEQLVDMYVSTFTAPHSPAEAAFRGVVTAAVSEGMERIKDGTFPQWAREKQQEFAIKRGYTASQTALPPSAVSVPTAAGAPAPVGK